MKDEELNKFFKENKQTIEDKGFEARLFETIKYLPEPKKRALVTRKSIIVSLFSLIGVSLFVITGGSASLLESLEQIFYTIANAGKVTPEIVVSAVLILIMFAGIGKLVVEEF
jgi:hypothetical protein